MTRGGRADLIVEGRIATFAADGGFGWVEALAVGEGRVLAAGPRTDVDGLATSATRRLRLGPNRVVVPGITDAHIHLLEAAITAEEIDLEETRSLDEATAIVAQAHARRVAAGDREGWLFGHGWLADRWGGLPRADALEAVAPGRPIALWAHDHHARWLSPAALAACGIDAGTPDPPGGIVGRESDGRPSGVLFEHATRIGVGAIPRPSPEELARAVIRHAARLAALGITGVQDPGGTAPDVSLDRGLLVCRGLAEAGLLPLRVHAGIRDEQLEAAIAAGLHSGDRVSAADAGDPGARRAADRFRVGWLKLFGDGSVGSRTAAMLEPYEAEPGRTPPAGPRGRLLESRERMTERVLAAAAAGIATMIHAIGDATVRSALDAFAAVPAADLARLPFRPRIEHAQLVHPDDVARFARLGVVASVQPVQLRSDEATMRRAWGDRTRYAYALASLEAAGAHVAFGTDAPVEPADPWPGIAMAICRQAAEWGDEVSASTPEEAISLERSLRAATVGPRWSAGEATGGRLVAGAPADLVVLPSAAIDEPVRPAGALATARPLLTLLDGEERFRDPGFDA
jgi:hypothetical protein